MRRTKILRASRFQQNRPRRADGQRCKGRSDVVGVDKLDRLGRSFQQLAQLISEFESHSTALVATSREIDTSESNPAGDCGCIFLLQSPNLNAVSATAFSGEVLASPSFLVAFGKAVGPCILLSAQSLTFMTPGNAPEEFLTESLTNIVQIAYNDRCSRC
jgi:Resolvase, N terminal domain